MKYTIVVHKSKYGYATHVPALPGCHSQGKSEREALRNTEDAIRTYLEMEQDEMRASSLRELEVSLA